MSQPKDNDVIAAPVVSNIKLSNTTSITGEIETKGNNKGSSDAVTVDAIILNVYLKYSYKELEDLVDDLMQPNKHLNSVSVLHQYALESTREPIDMGNQSNRTKYEPNLFTRKNDAFGLWHFNFLLNLLELDYEYAGADGNQFPKLWKTTSTTKVRINKVKKDTQQTSASTESKVTSTQQQQDDGTLIGLLKAVCRQNKYDEKIDATIWLNDLKGMNKHFYRISLIK
jgi:hypothetical protein